jgi:arylsulfatase A
MKTQLLLAWIIVLLLGRCSATAALEEPARPNIVFILADDLGWADLACYGSDLHETPNLDRLAREGMRFTDAYSASPVCTPTRVSLLTGQHPARLHMTIWREAAYNRGNRKLLHPICRDSLPVEETTFAELLKEVGYYNVHLGKWHVGRAEAYPQVHGFHRNIGGTLWGAPQSFWHPFNGEAYFRDWRYVPDLEPTSQGDYLTDVLTDKAIAVIEKQAAAKRPFFVNLWYHTVHTPIEGKPDLVEHYRKKITDQHRQQNPHYAAMVHSLDENVGRVLAKIEELGLRQNTLVVFSSDNGGFTRVCKLNKGLQVANNTPLRSGKGSCYEGGIRVPLIVRGPGVVANQECSTPVISCDLFHTFLDAAKIEERPDSPTDGVSLQPLLHNPRATLDRDTLNFHYPHYYSTTSPVSAIRQGNWKLLEYYEDKRVELYRLDKDLGESTNLASSEPGVAQRLRDKLHVWRQQVGALEPEPNPAKRSKK